MAYRKVHSWESLAAGIVSAILLLIGYSLLGANPRKGYTISLATAACLVLVFIERCVKTAGDPKSLGRNIGLAVLSLIVGVFFAVCAKSSGDIPA